MKRPLLLLLALFAGSIAMAQQFKSLSVPNFEIAIHDSNTVILDVRTAQEYATGHLLGAQNLVFDQNFEQTAKRAKLDATKTYAVYCRSGRRSKAAAKILASMGYTVIELDLGIIGWQKSHFDIFTSQQENTLKAEAAARKAKRQAEIEAEIKAVESNPHKNDGPHIEKQ